MPDAKDDRGRCGLRSSLRRTLQTTNTAWTPSGRSYTVFQTPTGEWFDAAGRDALLDTRHALYQFQRLRGVTGIGARAQDANGEAIYTAMPIDSRP